MPTISSSPATFTIGTGPFPETHSKVVTFAIPAGVWGSASWSITATWNAVGTNYANIATASGSVSTTPAHGNGVATDGATATALQLADINAAAGGNLSVTITAPEPISGIAAGEVAFTAFTLTLNACTYSLNPSGASYDGGAHSGTFDVVTASPCAWTASPDDSWLHVTAGGSGTGNGTVSYSVDANPYPNPGRTGTITVGDATFTVEQLAGADPLSGTGAITVENGSSPIYHPHTNAVEQFLSVSFPHGYMPGVNTNVGNLERILFNLLQPHGAVLAVLTGTTLRCYTLDGAELASGTPLDGVDIWRFGY